jgi:hypothetical protein
LEVMPGCSCVAVGNFKKLVSPGENGSLRLRYNVGDQIGKIHRAIAVKTGLSDTTQLVLQGEVIEWFKVSTRLLVWNSDDTMEPKIVEIKLDEGVRAVIAPIAADQIESKITQVSESIITISIAPKKNLAGQLTLKIPIEFRRSDPAIVVHRNIFVVVR